MLALTEKLDLATVAIADVVVTATLGCLLLFAWFQSRSSIGLGWWGIAKVLQAGGIVLLLTAEATKSITVLKFATIIILVSYALMWTGARHFDGRTARPFLVFSGVFLWSAAAGIGMPWTTVGAYFMLFSAINGTYCFAIAFEFWRGRTEPLVSRWPAIVLLTVSGSGFMSWIPLTLVMPFGAENLVFPENWFAGVILITMLGKMALVFIFLAMAKERLELRQKNEALTDPLTGLPNRRAFFRQAVRRLRPSRADASPVAVLLFDLDHFKSINDRFGHAVGDEVLRSFASILMDRLKATDVIGRVGGEEFAALLPETDIGSATATADRVRREFERLELHAGDTAVAATVSVGVVVGRARECNLHLLLAHADTALYAAKRAGRNRVKAVYSYGEARNDDRGGLPSAVEREAVSA